MMLYGEELWGWEKKGNLEKVRLKYLKWVLDLDKIIHNYIVLDET